MFAVGPPADDEQVKKRVASEDLIDQCLVDLATRQRNKYWGISCNALQRTVDFVGGHRLGKIAQGVNHCCTDQFIAKQFERFRIAGQYSRG